MSSLYIVIEKLGQDPVLVQRPFSSLDKAHAAWLKEAMSHPNSIILDPDLVQVSGMSEQVSYWAVAEQGGCRQVFYVK